MLFPLVQSVCISLLTLPSVSLPSFAFQLVRSASVMNLFDASVATFPGRIAVPFHIPDVIVPRVFIFALPDQVERAVFSTLQSPTFDFARLVIHVGSA